MNNVEINKDVKLSEHFTLAEMTKTSVKTAVRRTTHRTEREEHLGALCGEAER